MRVRHAVAALLAAALGVWAAVAVAEGGLGVNSCSPRAPKHPHGFSGGTGTALPVSTGALAATCEVASGGHKRHERSGEQRGVGHRPASEGHGKPLNFTFSVRLLPGAGATRGSVTGYSTHLLRPQGAAASCSPQLARRANIASRNQVARIHVRAPAGGWCDGHYRVTVTLTH
jgi:hypothetical protein